MTLPSRENTIRENIKTAILNLTNWPADVPVELLGFYTDVFYRGHLTAVGVCLTTDDWHNLEDGLNDFLDHEATIDVQIVVFSTSEIDPSGALKPDDGRIDALIELLLGSNRPGFGAGIRTVDVGVPGVTGEVRLRAVHTLLVADPKRAEGSGGGLAKILTMRTTSLGL